MKSHQLEKSFAAFFASKIGSTPKAVELLMSGDEAGVFSAEVREFAAHAKKTFDSFNSGFLKQRHVNEIFSDIEYLGIK